MVPFYITPLNERWRKPLAEKIDNLTKPKGSLGRLEELALQLGMIQQSLSPELSNPTNIVFCADHGIVDEGVSFSPKEVTYQQLFHFLRGGAGISFVCQQHHFTLQVVDMGVDYNFPADLAPTAPMVEYYSHKVRMGTDNYLYRPAMTHQEMDQCLIAGAAQVDICHEKGCNIVSFGELGMANTSSSSIWMHLFANIPLVECVGAGSGLPTECIRHKYQVLQQAVDNYHGDRSAEDLIAYFGGLEMVAAIGGMLRAAELHMAIIVDGFIMTACVLAAAQLHPHVLDYCIFGHCGDESGHKRMLDALGAKPILNLGLRLGEGSGAVCAYPIIQSAVAMINHMDSFANASVTKYF